jgi:hypothetical protein
VLEDLVVLVEDLHIQTLMEVQHQQRAVVQLEHQEELQVLHLRQVDGEMLGVHLLHKVVLLEVEVVVLVLLLMESVQELRLVQETLHHLVELDYNILFLEFQHIMLAAVELMDFPRFLLVD